MIGVLLNILHSKTLTKTYMTKKSVELQNQPVPDLDLNKTIRSLDHSRIFLPSPPTLIYKGKKLQGRAWVKMVDPDILYYPEILFSCSGENMSNKNISDSERFNS